MATICAEPLTVATTRFGRVSVEEEFVVTLVSGMIGFENCRRFVVLHHDPGNALRWFQCLDDGSVAFPIMDPRVVDPAYAPTISDADAASLGLTIDCPKIVFAVVTIPSIRPNDLTANLLGPIVINPITRVGKQVVVCDDRYRTKHPVLEHIEKAAVTQVRRSAEGANKAATMP